MDMAPKQQPGLVTAEMDVVMAGTTKECYYLDMAPKQQPGLVTAVIDLVMAGTRKEYY